MYSVVLVFNCPCPGEDDIKSKPLRMFYIVFNIIDPFNINLFLFKLYSHNNLY